MKKKHTKCFENVESGNISITTTITLKHEAIIEDKIFFAIIYASSDIKVIWVACTDKLVG